MIRKPREFCLSDGLLDLARKGAVLLANECQTHVDQATDVEDRVEKFFRDNSEVEENVKEILKTEEADVPGLLGQRSAGEERKEDPSAVRRDSSSKLVDVLAFDIASLIARRNGLGPATSRNGLREKIPASIAKSDGLKHMHVGYRFILANALLRMKPDPVVRTRLVSRPRELLRDDLDVIVAGSSMQAVSAAEPKVAFVPAPDPDLEIKEVTRAREAYRVALGNAVCRVPQPTIRRGQAPIYTLEDTLISQDLSKGADRAETWLQARVYRDATLKQLDGMLEEAAMRRRMMTETRQSHVRRELFAESLRAASKASSIQWDADLEARIDAQKSVIRRAEHEVHTLAEKLVLARGTEHYDQARRALERAVEREIPEFYCHKAALEALQEVLDSKGAVDLSTLMQTRLALALNILGEVPLCRKAC